jgi:hypothetical protein
MLVHFELLKNDFLNTHNIIVGKPICSKNLDTVSLKNGLTEFELVEFSPCIWIGMNLFAQDELSFIFRKGILSRAHTQQLVLDAHIHSIKRCHVRNA